MLYKVKNRNSPTSIYPVPTEEAGGPVAIIHPVIGQLAADEYADCLHVTDDGKSSLIKVGSRAGWVVSRAVTKQPFLLVDLYRKELSGRPPMDKIVATPFLSGVILKCTQGTSYPTAWFTTYWQAIKTLAGDHYGRSFFRGAYCFLEYRRTGKDQALYYLDTVKKAGGWGLGDIVPIVDVENTDSVPGQNTASAQQVIDVTSAFSEAILERHGRRPMLYGGSALRDRKIVDHMGCQKLWTARYTAELPGKAYQSVGWVLPEVWGWQYGGTGPAQRAQLVGYPKDVPGVGQLDISVAFVETYADLVVQPFTP